MRVRLGFAPDLGRENLNVCDQSSETGRAVEAVLVNDLDLQRRICESRCSASKPYLTMRG
jgi:hypothetical protein